MSRRAMVMLSLLIACAVPAGCDRRAPATPIVCVSVLPQAYFVDRIAGDLVETHVMIPPGASPTTHEPTPSQLRAAADASVYFKIGHPSFPFERTWLDRLIGESARAVDTSVGLTRRDGDPHTWVAPGTAIMTARTMAAVLSEEFPQHSAVFQANLRQLEMDVEALDAELREQLSPHRGKTFFVAHPAWGYFADQYGLTQASVERDNKQPSPAAFFEFIEAARASGTTVVLVQPQFSARHAQIVADEIGAKLMEADPLAPDWLGNTRRFGRLLAEALDE